MRMKETAIPDVKIVRLAGIADPRGMFFETFDFNKFKALGLHTDFVMDATSRNTKAGTVRGLHYQAPPHAQAKLVRVSRGRALDVAVDIRHGSPSFGQHVAIELNDRDLFWLYIPEGFLHGFCTLEDETEITYKLSDHYASETAKGVLWSDPALDIDWPVSDGQALLSEKDRALPNLSELAVDFTVKEVGGTP